MINENFHEKFNTLIQETVIEKKKKKKKKRKKTQINFLIITLIIKVFQ